MAAVGEAILGGPSLAQESHGFIEARRRFGDGNGKPGEFGIAVAFADAKIQAAVGQKIKRCHLLRQ